MILPATLMIFSSVVLSPTSLTPNNFLQLLIIQHSHLYVSLGFFSPFLFTCFFFLSLPSGCQMFLSVTWWRWCWRLLCPRSPKDSTTCCCARLGSYWVCLKATSWFKKLVHFTSRGELHTSYNILILCSFTFFLCIFLEV